ncbi:MAG: TIGR03663 family protein [Acidobacteria bacterium]|nr:TIGR03663 family protein [Acidobacteriota bacterium]
MSTASTKRARKKAQAGNWGTTSSSAPAKARDVAETTPPHEGAVLPERVWLYASLAILALATLLRLSALELKPMHHDEGVNGFFLTTLLRSGVYKYDPTNYHGPTLYYLTLPSVALMGLSTFAVRFVTALSGIATVWLVLSLRRHIGAVGALAAAALVAVSPGAVFYSRYFIHETLFVFFTLGLVVAALRFYETRQVWYLMLLAASAAMLFATKETAFISAGALVLAALVSWVWVRFAGGAGAQTGGARDKRRASEAGREFGWRSLLESFGGSRRMALLICGALALFVFINVIFYSSFFTYRQGLGGAIDALAVWKKTGTSDFHGKPSHTYLNWLWQEEAPILMLGAVGSAVALFERRKNRFAVFAGAWAFGLLLAYMLIPYKTPWLMLSFVVPLAVIAGYAVQTLSRLPAQRLSVMLLLAVVGGLLLSMVGGYALPTAGVQEWFTKQYAVLGVGNVGGHTALVVGFVLVLTALGAYFVWASGGTARGGGTTAARGAWSDRARASALVVGGLAVAVCLYQTVVLNFLQYDNDTYPYVYSHTQREAKQMLEEVERISERAGKPGKAGIGVTSQDYWPLPWYFRDNPHVGYEGKVSSYYDPKSTLVVIGNESQLPQLQRVLAESYRQVGGVYPLRPGVRLVLFARRDLVEP